MRIRISDATALGDLQAYLEATECAVQAVSSDELDVSIENAPSPAQGRREIEAYLQMWQALNPAVDLTVAE